MVVDAVGIKWTSSCRLSSCGMALVAQRLLRAFAPSHPRASGFVHCQGQVLCGLISEEMGG